MRGAMTFPGSDSTPSYTIKTVVQETGINPASLRAWERRYRVLAPGRSEGGYRLYSDRDIATLRWLKNRVDAGVTISRAVALLEAHHQAGVEPELALAPGGGAESLLLDGRVPTSRDLRSITQELTDALLAFRETDADRLLSEAFALHSIETVAEDIMAPVLIAIGERWRDGGASIVQEHFATAVLRRRLNALFAVYAPQRSGPLAVAATAPGEWHDVGVMMVSMVLRRFGWTVVYVGQNVPAADLVREVTRLRPDLLCLSATLASSVEGFGTVQSAIGSMSEPRPRLALGGRAFKTDPELRLQFPNAVFCETASQLPAALAGR